MQQDFCRVLRGRGVPSSKQKCRKRGSICRAEVQERNGGREQPESCGEGRHVSSRARQECREDVDEEEGNVGST